LPDIFISYSRDDQAIARRYAEGFEREGLSVWWDQTLDPGDAYDHVTEKALKDARAVVVLWSGKSVDSRWVRAEATQAARLKTLVPVMIEPCDRPIMFELTHTADLSHWTGTPNDPAWQAYVAGVRRFIERGRAQGAQALANDFPNAAGAGASGSGGRSRSIKTGLAVLALLLIAGTAAYFLKRPPSTATASLTPPTIVQPISAKPRIAIMPFENLSPDPANAFFADGMHEEILTALSNSAPGLEVISRTTMMTYRAAPKAVAELAKELGAIYVLEGSVRRDGEDVRLTLQLIDAKTDGHIWSQNFDRKLVKAMTLQSEVAGAVASQLAVQLTPAARAASTPPTRDPIAYDLYLQARLATHLLSGASSTSEIKRIYDLYSAAIGRDPEFGLAYLGRVSLGPVGIEDQAQLDAWQKQAALDLAAARRLLGNDPRVALMEATNAIGGPQHDISRTLAMFESAEAQGVNDPEFLAKKTATLVAAGRVDDAVSLSQRLVTLDPANPVLLLMWAANLYLDKRPAESMRAMDQYIGRLPPDARPVWLWIRNHAQFAYTGESTLLSPPDGALVAPQGFDQGVVSTQNLKTLRYQKRYREIGQLLKLEKGPLMPAEEIFECYNLYLPLPPVAEVRGWTNLLMGDRVAARSDGRELASAIGGTWDFASDVEWLKRLRQAEAYLFIGEQVKAATTAREVLDLMPRSRNALVWAFAASRSAAVLAWAGEKDAAAALLEQLSAATPGLGPASIARDPIYTEALANNARYKALKTRLEAQMAATKI
jgi:TolB-like protein